MRSAWPVFVGLAVACTGSKPRSAPSKPASGAHATSGEANASSVASAAPIGAVAATSVASPRPLASTAASGIITWYRDDPEAAFAQARREKKLVVVDLWAPWCHTCLSMQAFVLTAAKLPGAGTRFVFSSIDTEQPKNADFIARFPTSGWPTFYVLAPDGPSVRGRWLGAASPGQFARFLADAERAGSPAAAEIPAEGESLALLAAAGQLAAERRYAEAAAKYRAALEHAPREWVRAPDVRVALASAQLKANDAGACVDLALSAPAADARAPISVSDFAASTLDCAERLPSKDARRRRARERAASELALLCEQGGAELTPDDRGDACGNLMAAREALGDSAGARRAAETRLAILEDAARGMPDDVALIYDPARSETLVALGRGEEALELLRAREAALPDNYNPPYYAARVALRLKRWELGLEAVDRALALAYGPRRANVYGLKADLLLGAGRRREAGEALESQVLTLSSLPAGQKRPEAERAARDRLSALQASRR